MRRRGVSACMCGGPVTALGTDKWDYLTPGRVLVAWFHCLRAVRVMGRYDTRVCTTLSLGQAGGRHRDRKLETWAYPRTGRLVPRVPRQLTRKQTVGPALTLERSVGLVPLFECLVCAYEAALSGG